MSRKIVVALTSLLLCSGAVQAEGEYNIDFGADYSSGDYGTGSDATLWSLPFALNYRADRWGWGVTVPYLILNSSGNVVVGGGGVIISGPGSGTSSSSSGMGSGSSTSNTTTQAGIGDVIVRGSLDLAEEGAVMPWIGVTLKAKIATADAERNLGTGENDYAAQLEMAKGPVDGYAGYKVLGDPYYANFNNVAYGALAYSLQGGGGNRYMIEGYMEQPVIDGQDGVRELSVILQHRIDNDRKISGYILKGFSDASPDWGAGVRLKIWL